MLALNKYMPKVSVIVPIYNVEKYLEKCIKSLVNQTLEDIQIILVNDGSTDNSGNIAKEYAQKYSNKILYLEKENGGLSDARNYGLKHATGEYISFVDSDDYINENLYSNLIEYMNNNYDMIKIKIIKVYNQGNKISENYSPEFKEKTGEEAFNTLYKTDVMTEVAWGYVYKTSFWKENNFEFTKNMYHEDFGLIPLVLLKANKVASTNIEGYYYVQSEQSITRNSDDEKKKKMSMDLITYYDNMIKQIQDYNIGKQTKENIKIYYTNCILLELNNISNKEVRQAYIKEIKKRKMTKNIKARNLKQLLKRIILSINIEWYLSLR